MVGGGGQGVTGQGKWTRHSGDEGGGKGDWDASGPGKASETEGKKARKPLWDTLNLTGPKVIGWS